MRLTSMVAAIAGMAAFVGWAGLALQLALLVQNMGVLPGLWRFAGFFTILANFGAALVATAMALGAENWLAGARARLMAATSILMVGLVYSIALRALWNPTGWQGVADEALHDAAPLIWLALWLMASHPRLAWREVGWALLPPAAYVAYALVRGAAEGWYAYWFLNPAAQGAGGFLLSVLVLLCGFTLAAALLVAVDRVLGGRSRSIAEV